MTMPVGRYRGWEFAHVPTAYLRWMRRQDGLSTELRDAIRERLSIRARQGVKLALVHSVAKTETPPDVRDLPAIESAEAR